MLSVIPCTIVVAMVTSVNPLVKYTWNFLILLESLTSIYKTKLYWVCIKWVGNLLNKVLIVEIISKKRLAFDH